jgi:excinuclease ABC subunit B
MAEELSRYLTNLGIRNKYIHSDVETLERVEIMQELRVGVFDVLIGVNLLREGLDLPEVSLVAILDADKEGFLRNDKALIQTIGRAARNANSRAIMYADTITKSMQKAIDENTRNRKKQEEYNKLHNIIPQQVKRSLNDNISTLKSYQDISQNQTVVQEKLAEYSANLNSPQQIEKAIRRLEEQMYAAVEELNFIKAAEYRDEIQKLKDKRNKK